MKRILISTIIILCAAILCGGISFAAVGCTLNDPDRDIKRMFPGYTGYRTEFITIEERGGEKLKKEVEERLEDKFDTIYETIDVPYAYYIIMKGKDVIGRVHGVNQKGMYGGMQIILATDNDGRIIDFYYQNLSSPEAAKFRNKLFTDQFKGLTLEDFYKCDEPGSRVSAIKDPTEKNEEDFKATIRGAKKSLILLDEFMLDKKYDAAYDRSVKHDQEK